MMKRFFLLACLAVSVISCTTEPLGKRVYGRYVPERKDDFAWENEYAAYRMYGPALLPENPSNGVDLWLKATPELIVDSFYYRELNLGLPYHINYGKGLDCYKVGHTAGCGGLVIVIHEPYCATTDYNGLYVGGPYSTWEILEQTDTRFVFRLHYDTLQVASAYLSADVTITTEAGSLLNRADVVLHQLDTVDLPTLYVGGGIYLHDSIDNLSLHRRYHTIAYAEDALSDRNAAQMNFDYNGSTSQGRSYSAVYTPDATLVEVIDGTAVAARAYTEGETLTYYFGACWSMWRDGNKSFPTDISWFEAVALAVTNN